jgi:mycofactocin system glycosyltransferase
VLIGGSPVRLLRLTAAGARLVDRWAVGAPVGRSHGAQALARRLLDAGMAHPRPPRRGVEGVAVVVPVRDDRTGLEATLESLAGTAPGISVVVVDDGSVPLVSAADDPGVQVVRREVSGGPARARNAGRDAVGSARIVVFIDAGCVLERGWLEPLLAHFADPAVGAVAPRVRSRALSPTPPDLAAYEDVHSSLDLGPREAPVRPFSTVPYVPTAVLAVRLAAFDSVGGFDGSFRFGEDVDLVWRLVEAGWTVRYEPRALARHPARPSIGAWLVQRYHYGRSATPLASRHGRAVAPVAVSPWSTAVWGLVAVGHPAMGAVVGALSAGVLPRRAGTGGLAGWELVRLAAGGHVRAAGPLARAVRRAWLPPFLVGTVLARRRGTTRWLVAAGLTAFVGPGLWEWLRLRPPVPAPKWVGLGLADDLAYQAGVWAGAVAGRSAGALLPKW